MIVIILYVDDLVIRGKNPQPIDNIIYLTITQPDLSYSIGLLSQFIQNPRDIHLDCAKRVVMYVCETMDYDIMYKVDMII